MARFWEDLEKMNTLHPEGLAEFLDDHRGLWPVVEAEARRDAHRADVLNLAFVLRDTRRATPEKSFGNHFGDCPECGGSHGYMNVRSNHWFVCDDHMTKWCIGSNLFSCWQEEPDALWAENARKLDAYRLVEPRRCVGEPGGEHANPS